LKGVTPVYDVRILDSHSPERRRAVARVELEPQAEEVLMAEVQAQAHGTKGRADSMVDKTKED